METIHEHVSVERGEVARAAFARQIPLDLADDSTLAQLLEHQASFLARSDADSLMRESGDLASSGLQAHAWLSYWQGSCSMWRNAAPARDALALAQLAFSQTHETDAARLAWCARVELELHAWGEPLALRTLVQTDEGALFAQTVSPIADIELLATACTAAALSIIEPQHNDIGVLALRAGNLLGQVADPGRRLRAAAKLMLCAPWLPEGLPLAMTREFDELAQCADVPVSARIEWCCASAAWQLECGGRLDAAARLIEGGLELARSMKLTRAQFRLDLLLARLHVVSGRLQDASDLLLGLSMRPDAGDKYEKAQIGLPKALLYGAMGCPAQAAELARALCRSSKVLGAHLVQRCRLAQAIAAYFAVAGDADSARAWMQDARAWACGAEVQAAGNAHALLEAVLRSEEGACTPGESGVRAAMSSHRLHFQAGLFIAAPAFASKVAELALEAGAEPGHVVDIIRAQRLIPATRTCASWPWPIKVCVLGAPVVTLDGEPVAAPGPSQADLLRVLAVAGAAGRSQQSLERQLWPQSNTPQAALAVALHRLRKLFANDQAVAAHDRTITLAPELVWTDAHAFAELCQRIEDLPDDAPQPHVRRLADQLLAIYRGNFDRDGDDPWYMAASARLRARFTAAAELLGHRLEACGDLKAAGSVYRRMLDTELLCETAYRGLMRIAHARGDNALAFAHYRLCRDTLSIVLNRPPSAATRRLAETLFPPQSPVGDTPANFATVSPACMAAVDEIASL